MKYKEIRENYQSNVAILTLVDRYCMCLSPFLTKIFVRKNIIPNDVTLLMIISGLIGGILFLINNIYIKIIGVIFIHLWYILDCSDGEVARITKKFSKFGKELDYIAHTVNHPVFFLSYAITLYQNSFLNPIYVLMSFFILCVLDMINRQILTINIIYELKIPSTDNSGIKGDYSKLQLIKSHVMMFIGALPNFALIFPVIYIIDSLIGTDISTVYLLFEVILLFICILNNVIKLILKIKNK